MSKVKFNHVFTVLLLLSLLSAFVLPRQTSGARAHIQGIFYPVAKPARTIASTLRGRFDGPEDKRAASDIVDENERLKLAVSSLTGQMEQLITRVAETEQFGPVGQFCKRVPVMGNDPASRDSLSVQGRFDVSLLNQPVLYIGGMAGRLERAGLTGAQVRLVTDRSFSATGRFGTFGTNELGLPAFQGKETTPPIVEGVGNGVMMVRNLEYKEAAEHVTEGMWVALDDQEYPSIIRYQKLGKVVSIKKRPESPLWADIEVRPEWNLMALTKVMVLQKPDEESAMSN